MGIDIYSYKKIEKIDCAFNSDGKPIDATTGADIEGSYVKFYVNPDFPGRADDIEDGAAYRYQESKNDFSSGYMGYGHLRNQLAMIAGYPLGEYEQFGTKAESYCVACWNGEVGPFSELINFSDCDGTIGSAVSKKLAKDFSDFEEKAKAIEDTRFLNFYSKMKAIFEEAAVQGAVKFH